MMSDLAKSWDILVESILDELNTGELSPKQPTAFNLEIASANLLIRNNRHAPINFVVLNGPAGAGKSTAGKILESLGYQRVPRITDRPQRVGEVDGKDYHFVSREAFERLAQKGGIVAQKTTYEFHRGFSRTAFYDLKNKRVRGYSEGDSSLTALKEIGEEAGFSPENVLHLFLIPPTFAEWQQRLEKQHHEGHFDQDEMQLRTEEGLHYIEKSIIRAKDFPRMLYLVNDDEVRIRAVLKEILGNPAMGINADHQLLFACNDQGCPEYLSTKDYSHQKGQYHWIVVAYLFNQKGDLLLQRRKGSGVWDHSSAGHIDAGEAAEDAIKREIKEELGITPPNLVFCSEGLITHPLTSPNRRHFFKSYSGKTEGPFIPDQNEVLEVKFFPVREIEHLLQEYPQDFSGGLHATFAQLKSSKVLN